MEEGLPVKKQDEYPQFLKLCCWKQCYAQFMVLSSSCLKTGMENESVGYEMFKERARKEGHGQDQEHENERNERKIWEPEESLLEVSETEHFKLVGLNTQRGWKKGELNSMRSED